MGCLVVNYMVRVIPPICWRENADNREFAALDTLNRSTELAGETIYE